MILLLLSQYKKTDLFCTIEGTKNAIRHITMINASSQTLLSKICALHEIKTINSAIKKCNKRKDNDDKQTYIRKVNLSAISFM